MGQLWPRLSRPSNPHPNETEQRVHRLADQARSIDASFLECWAIKHWLTVQQLHQLYFVQQQRSTILTLSSSTELHASTSPSRRDTMHLSHDTEPSARDGDELRLALACLPTSDHPGCCQAHEPSSGVDSSLIVQARPLLTDVIARTQTYKADAPIAYQSRPPRDRSQMFRQSAKHTVQQVTYQMHRPAAGSDPVHEVAHCNTTALHVLYASVDDGPYEPGSRRSGCRGRVRSDGTQAA